MADAVRIEISVEAVDNTSKTVQELILNLQSIGTAANKTQSGMDKASSSVSKFDAQADKTTKTLQGWMKQKWQLALEAKDRVSPVLSTLKSGLNSLTSRAWSVTMRVFDFITSPVRGIINLLRNPLFQAGSILGISVGLKDTIDTYKEFESAMSQVQAVSGASSSELEKLTEKAKEMGATTKFTAEESAEAFNYMAMAGWKTSDMMNGIEGILSLAAASGEDLATTADIVTDALTAFGMTAGDAGHFSDVLAAASSNANTNVGMMGETFKYVGAMAGTLGYSIEDTALAIGLMANAGIKSSQAGTELNSIFTRLSVNTNGARDAIENLGISFFDSTGTARPFADVLGELRTATANYTDEQKTNLANTIAGQRAQAGLLAMLNASTADYNKLAEAVSNADGASARMSETMLDNLQGSFTLLQSAVDGVKISLGERLAPYVRSFADGLTARMPAVQRAVNQFMDWFDGKVELVKQRYQDAIDTEGFEDMGIFDKAKILWEKIISDPFHEWWNSTGKKMVADAAQDIGMGLGTGIKNGLLALLGIDISGTTDEGVSIGRSFAQGFMEGFDTDTVGAALKTAIRGMFSDVGKLLPGGETPGLDTAISAFLLYKMVTPAIALGKGAINVGKGIFGTPASGGPSLASLALGSASAGTGLLGFGANTAITLGAGNLAGGASLSAGALSALGLGAVAGGAIGAGTAISGVVDFVKASKAEDQKEKDLYNETGTMKVGGALSGAAVGAAVGAMLGPLGIAAGALIGAGVGGIAGLMGSNKRKKEYEEQQKQIEEAAAAEARAHEVITAKAAYTGQAVQNITFKSQELNDAFHDTEVSAEDFGAMFQKAVSQKIQAAFGNITLSLQEIKSLADSIVFDGMSRDAENFGYALETSEKTLSDVKADLTAIEKNNWRASLGFDFSADELKTYQTQVENFVKDATSYIENKHYEATLALRLITGGEGDTAALDTAYASITQQVNDLTAQLQETLSAALADGVITNETIELDGDIIQINELEAITSLQNQITEILNTVSAAESEASLSALKIKYGGTDLDYASFQQLQAELDSNIQSMTASYDEALKVSLTNLELQLAQGAISEEEKAALEQELSDNYHMQIDEMNVRVESFQLDTLAEAFSSELDAALEASDLQGTTSEKLKTILETALAVDPEPAQWTTAQISQWLGLDQLGDSVDPSAISEVFRGIAASLPKSISNEVKTSLDAMDLTEAQEVLKTTLNTDIAEAIEKADLAEALSGLAELQALVAAQAAIEFGKEIPVTVPVTVTYDYTQTNPNVPAPNVTAQSVLSDPNLNQAPSYMGGVSGGHHRATGGFTNGAELSWVGEDGPEAIIPLSMKRRERGLELYEQVGKILGVAENANGGVYGFHFSPYPSDTNLPTEREWDVSTHSPAPPMTVSAEPITIDAQTPPTSAASGLPPVSISVQVQPSFVIDGGDRSEDELVEILRRHMADIADDIGDELAERLVPVFDNMPLKGAT